MIWLVTLKKNQKVLQDLSSHCFTYVSSFQKNLPDTDINNVQCYVQNRKKSYKYQNHLVKTNV